MVALMNFGEMGTFLKTHLGNLIAQKTEIASPHIIFLPVPDDYEAQFHLQSLLGELQAINWLIFSTFGSFQQKEENLYPILQIIREILFIDDEIVEQNAQLPPEDRLPQIGSYIIPDFLQSIPQIDTLYKLMARLYSPEETRNIFSQISETLESQTEEILDAFEERFHTLYQTILDVFATVAKELFQIDGMIFLYNDLHMSDTNSLQWLEYSAITPVKLERPIIIIACFPESLSAEFLQNWPPQARFSLYDPTQPFSSEDANHSLHLPNESSSPKNTINARSENGDNLDEGIETEEDPPIYMPEEPEHPEDQLPEEYLALEAKFLYDYLSGNGMIKKFPPPKL